MVRKLSTEEREILRNAAKVIKDHRTYQSRQSRIGSDYWFDVYEELLRMARPGGRKKGEIRRRICHP